MSEEEMLRLCKGCIHEDDHIDCHCSSEYVYLAGLAEGRKESEQFIIFHDKEEMEVLRNLLDEECNKGTVNTVIWNLRSRLNTRLIKIKE